MPDPQEPREYDAVLGGKNPPLPDSAVLGGIEGVKRRLASKFVEIRVAALRDALNYGDAGLDLVIEALQDESTQVKDAAVKLLSKRKEYKVQLALLLRLTPVSPYSYNKRGLARQKLGDLEGAINDFTQAIVRYYRNPDYYCNRGLCYQQLGDIKEAIYDFSRAISIKRKYYDAYFYRGICLQSIGSFKKAKKDFLYSIRFIFYSAIAHYNCGLCSDELKQYNYAIHHYSNAIEINPTYPHSYMRRAQTNTTLGNYQEAIEDYIFIIDGNFNQNIKALAYNYRGALYDSLENYQQAIADANQAIELQHDNLEWTYENRGISKYKLGDVQGALADFSQAIAINPNYYRVYNSRGFVKSAMENHQEAIAINPDYIDAYINRGESRTKLEDFIGAITDFSRIITLNPPSPEIYYYNRGVCHLS